MAVRQRVSPIWVEQQLSASEQFRRYGRVIKCNVLLIGLCVLAALGGGFAYTTVQPVTYSSTATLLIQDSPTKQVVDPNASPVKDAERRLETEIEVLKSSSVLAAARDRLGYEPRVKVGNVRSTDTIEVTAYGSTAEQAAASANAYVDAYVELHRQRMTKDLTQSIADIQQRVADVDRRLLEITMQIADIDRALAEASQSDKGALQTQRRELVAKAEIEKVTLADQRSYFTQQIDRLNVALNLSSRGGPEVISAAEIPSGPSDPDLTRNLSVSMAVGLLVGIGGAFLRETLEESIRSRSDLEAMTPDLPILGVIPAEVGKSHRRSKSSTIERRLLHVAKPTSTIAEAHRVVRLSIQFAGIGNRSLKTIQVTSPEPEDGKTSTAANLAASFALAGARVVAVCCDWRKPRLHECFDLENRVGFTSVLLGEATISEAAQRAPGFRNLFVVASGPIPVNPAELLGMEKTRKTLSSIRELADVVIVDSPPVLPVSDSLVLAPLVDATLLVVRAQKSSRRAVLQAIDLLHQVDGELLGSVLVGVDRSEANVEKYGQYSFRTSQRRVGRYPESAVHEFDRDLEGSDDGMNSERHASSGSA